MLLLSRHVNESIIITVGDQRIVVTVVSIDRGKVRIGVEASPIVKIHRLEVQEQIDAGNQRSK